MIKLRNERKTHREAKFISIFANRCGFPNEEVLYFSPKGEK